MNDECGLLVSVVIVSCGLQEEGPQFCMLISRKDIGFRYKEVDSFDEMPHFYEFPTEVCRVDSIFSHSAAPRDGVSRLPHSVVLLFDV
jgi:hypothetical protein